MITDSVKSYNADYKAQVQTPLTEWQKQVTTVLRTMISKTHEARDHLDHYEMKLVTVENQHTKLAASSSSTPDALEQATLKVSRNQTKLAAAQAAYDECVAGLEQCSRTVDQAAADIWPLIQKVLSLEQSYTGTQLVTVQGRLTALVNDLHAVASDREPTPSLQEILTLTMSNVEQPMLAGASSVRNAAAPKVKPSQKTGTTTRKVEPPPAVHVVSASSDDTPQADHRSAPAALAPVRKNTAPKKQIVDADTMDASINSKDGSSPRGVTEAVVPAAGVEDPALLPLSSTVDAVSPAVVVKDEDEPSTKNDTTITPLDVSAVQEEDFNHTKSAFSEEDSSTSIFLDEDAAPAADEGRKSSEETIPTCNTNNWEEDPTKMNAPADEVSADKMGTPLKSVPQEEDVSETEIMDDEEDDIYAKVEI